MLYGNFKVDIILQLITKFESKISENNQINQCQDNITPSVCPKSKSNLMFSWLKVSRKSRALFSQCRYLAEPNSTLNLAESEKLEEIESVEVFEIDQIKIGVEFACSLMTHQW